MNWIEKSYPIGKKFLAPHPFLGDLKEVKVVNHTVRGRKVIGVRVQNEEGIYYDIDAAYLDETSTNAD